MKRILPLIIALVVPVWVACSPDKLNREMHELVNSKEHDPMLFGWWQSQNNDDQLLFFDEVDYKFIHGNIDDEGNFVVSYIRVEKLLY